MPRPLPINRLSCVDRPYFDNRGVLYTGALPPDALAFINATIDRFDAVPSVLNFQEHYYQPTGDLEIPTLTLSLSRDPVAPGFHRTLYASLVAAAGDSDHLVQRTVDRYGHCDQLTARRKSRPPSKIWSPGSSSASSRLRSAPPAR